MKNRMREESYGWIILPANALDAYEEAIEYFGKESLDEQIVESLSQEELAKSLEFIFRMNDFNESSYLEESYSKKKPCTKGGKKGMRENESFSILKRYEKRYGK